MTFGQTLKEIMHIRKYTFKYLAEKTGFSGPTIVMDRLRRGNMRTDTLIKLADGLDCDIIIRSRKKDKLEWLVNGEPEIESTSEE